MGRSHGRGAKSVAIVTHAQVKRAKKTPRGLRATARRQRRAEYRHEAAMDDPNSLADTGDRPGQGKKGNKPAKTIVQQIAGIHFKENVPRGKGKLKHLRKQLLNEVSNLRRKHHRKQEARAKHEMRNVERQAAAMERARLAEEEKRILANVAAAGVKKPKTKKIEAASAGKKVKKM